MPPETHVLIQISGPDGQRNQKLAEGVFLLGRQPGNDVVLDSPQVSRKHAQIEVRGGDIKITDLGSANGTRVDGEIIGQQLAFSLREGSLIRLGPFEILIATIEVTPGAEVVQKEPEQADPAEGRLEISKGEKKGLSEAAKKKGKVDVSLSGGGGQPPKTPDLVQEDRNQPGSGGSLQFELRSQRLINYLPGIYQTDFMQRFLGLFESMLLPVEWIIDSFDVFLDVDSSPAGFLSWLAGWYGIVFDSTWPEDKQRTFIREAVTLYGRRGTRWSLARMLEIYTGIAPEINDEREDIKPFHFEVVFKKGIGNSQRELVEQIIDHNKPAQSFYNLKLGS